MNEAWNYERCVSILTGEIELLKHIYAAQEQVREAVMNREWTEFDERTEDVKLLGGKLACLEEERALLFTALRVLYGNKGTRESKTAEDTPFYALVLGLPEAERKELACLYRELKAETLKMRALNESFLNYLSEVKTVAAAYLEAICPARGGKLYTRKGHKVSQDLRSIVFNNRF